MNRLDLRSLLLLCFVLPAKQKGDDLQQREAQRRRTRGGARVHPDIVLVVDAVFGRQIVPIRASARRANADVLVLRVPLPSLPSPP
jgi:hypothetical protein